MLWTRSRADPAHLSSDGMRPIEFGGARIQLCNARSRVLMSSQAIAGGALPLAMVLSDGRCVALGPATFFHCRDLNDLPVGSGDGGLIRARVGDHIGHLWLFTRHFGR